MYLRGPERVKGRVRMGCCPVFRIGLIAFAVPLWLSLAEANQQKFAGVEITVGVMEGIPQLGE